ncbi:hypothetical protein PP713_14195 [Mycobacterium sp. CSUR Q5927]|nr:hypothetical protein [Mycobacterium sp. CSUR Q5927]
MKSADRAWLTLGAGVIAWDATCPAGCTLSEAVDYYLERRPWLTRAVVALVALHLINALPSRLDPLHLLFGWRQCAG